MSVPLGDPGRPSVRERRPRSAASRWLDSFADRSARHLGAGSAPYLTFAVAGLGVGIPLLLVLGTVRGVPPLSLVAVVIWSLAGFAGLGLAQKALIGRERHVLWESLLVVLGVGTAIGAASPAPVLVVLDVQVVSLGAVLAVARWGCLAHGCCHGKPAGWGVRYRAGLHADDPLTGVRLFPVPVLDSAALTLASAWGAGLVLLGAPAGQALTSWLLGYGAARFFLELVRGDRRPQWGPLSEAQWTFVAVVVAVVGLRSRGGVAVGEALVAAAGVVVLVLAFLGRTRWLALDRREPTLEEVSEWEPLLESASAAARSSYRPQLAWATFLGRVLQLAVTVDRLDPGRELHCFTVRRPEGFADLDDAALCVGLILQRLPGHEVVRLEACSHQALLLWVRVEAAGRPGSSAGDDPHEVRLRVLAAVRPVWATDIVELQAAATLPR